MKSNRNGARRPTDPSLLRTRVARWLEDHLVEKDWNQFTLAQRSRVSQAYINVILRGGRLPDDGKILQLAKALGEPGEELLNAVYRDRIERLLEDAPTVTRMVLLRRLKP